ncbi:acyl-CoA dehydrogenase family protein [Phenylobacterium sp.]|uniref:acyl-CoA dehydrogenase family protein n=1 Tax=Phenylobacterium sp. TaxID=1871053 RepID=UPI00286A705A|nr:acyl-CoA dehydrogenase family protein [Phenylobacterium sp.]
MTVEQDLIAHARRIAAQVAPRGAEIEAARRIPRDIHKAMGDAGFYRMFVTTDCDGLEVSPRTAAEVYEALAQGDAACGWVAFIAATTTLAFGRMTNAAVCEIMARPDSLATGVFAANGVATRVEDGFRVTGRWDWGSGSPNADWIGGGCVLVEDGETLKNSAGLPRNHMLFFRADQVKSLDTWHVAGLSGTGSTAFEVDDVFVPERHAAGVQVKALPDRPLYRFPSFSPLAQGIGGVALGIARGALDEATRVVGEKRRGGSSAPLAERAHTQMEIARAEARLRAARAFFYQTIDAAWDAAQSPEPVPLALSRDMRLAVNHAVSESTAVVDAMYTLAGGSSIYAASPLQRQFRDIHVATQHFMVSPNILETVGRLYLGLPTNTAGF